jgi:hypothetical protein
MLPQRRKGWNFSKGFVQHFLGLNASNSLQPAAFFGDGAGLQQAMIYSPTLRHMGTVANV